VKSDVGIDEGTPEDRGHWLTFPAGSLVVLPDLHEIEGLVSSGALLPYELGPGPGDVE
jgi:hypothetical protein